MGLLYFLLLRPVVSVEKRCACKPATIFYLVVSTHLKNILVKLDHFFKDPG